MSAKNRHGTCGYCAKQRKLTRDHIPPKPLLEQPYPANLLTVPACYECNQSFMKDDEYTRTVLAVDIRASRNRAAQSKLPAIIRSLQDPEGQGFAAYLASQTAQTAILGPDGTPMAEVIDVDRERLRATGSRLIRGLYFIEMGTPIPESAILRVASKVGLAQSDAHMATIGRVYGTWSDHRTGAVGDAFSYFAAVGPRVSFWLVLLYDYFLWGGTVDEREISEREADPAPPQ
jgi:hypothetical protein